MKKKIIFVVAILVAIILLSITLFYNKENPTSNQSNGENPIIGGDRDEHGCLGPAGYSYNETLGFCLREWEITGDYRGAIEFSSKSIPKEYGLTVDRVENATCYKCFTIWYDTIGSQKSIEVFPPKNYCPESKGDYCIQSWDPVCAFGDFGNKTFSNSCTACLNKSVSYYFYKECQ